MASFGIHNDKTYNSVAATQELAIPCVGSIVGFPATAVSGSLVYAKSEQSVYVSNGNAWTPVGGESASKLMVYPTGPPGPLGGLLVNANSTIPPLVYQLPFTTQPVFSSVSVDPFINDPGSNFRFTDGQSSFTILKSGTYRVSFQFVVLGVAGFVSAIAQMFLLPTTGIFQNPPILSVGTVPLPFNVPPVSLVYQLGMMSSSTTLTKFNAGDQIGIVIYIDAPGQTCEIPLGSSILCIERVSV